MRHKVAGRKFDRPTDHRLAMFRNLVTDLLRHEQIKTTEAKAKEIRGLAENEAKEARQEVLRLEQRVAQRDENLDRKQEQIDRRDRDYSEEDGNPNVGREIERRKSEEHA